MFDKKPTAALMIDLLLCVLFDSSLNGTIFTVIKLTFFMSTFNPDVYSRLDSLLAEIGDNDHSKICEFEIILRHILQA